MTDQELRMLSAAIQSQLADAAVPDEVILGWAYQIGRAHV